MSTLALPPEIPVTVDRRIEVPADWGGEFVPDEVLIRRLLASNEHCLWQTEIVDAMSVSKATVSRRLTEMESAGDVRRLQFRGRKLVWIPDA